MILLDLLCQKSSSSAVHRGRGCSFLDHFWWWECGPEFLPFMLTWNILRSSFSVKLFSSLPYNQYASYRDRNPVGAVLTVDSSVLLFRTCSLDIGSQVLCHPALICSYCLFLEIFPFIRCLWQTHLLLKYSQLTLITKIMPLQILKKLHVKFLK